MFGYKPQHFITNNKNKHDNFKSIWGEKPTKFWKRTGHNSLIPILAKLIRHKRDSRISCLALLKTCTTLRLLPSFHFENKEDRPCTYKVVLWCVPVTTVAMKTQKYLPFVLSVTYM